MNLDILFNFSNDFNTFLYIFAISILASLIAYTVLPRKKFLSSQSNTIAVFIILLFSLYYIGISCINYRFYLTGGDLPIFTEIFANTIKGDFLQSTIQHGRYNFLAHHFSPILILLVPLYFLFSSPYTLLVIQGLVFTAGAWPLFRFTAAKSKSNFLAAAITTSYLLAPLQLEDLLYDFHPAYFTPTFVLFTLYFLSERKKLFYFISFALLLLCKTDSFIYAASIGFYALFKKETRKIGYLSIIFSLVYTGIGLCWLKPLLAKGSDLQHHNWFLKRYHYLGTDFGSAAKNIFFHPLLIIKDFVHYNPLLKLRSLCFIFIPVAALPLLSGSALIPLAGAILVMFLSNNWVQNSLMYHYSTVIYAFTFFATAIGACWLVKNRSLRLVNACSAYILIAGLLTHFFFSEWTPARKFNYYPYFHLHKVHLTDSIIDLIQPGDSITCRHSYACQLLQNHPVTIIKAHSKHIPDHTDYILVDEQERHSKYLRQILAEKKYGVVHVDPSFMLLKKGYNTRKNDVAFATFFMSFEGERTPHCVGINTVDPAAHNIWARHSRKDTDQEGSIAYGPYQRYPTGHYQVKFYLKTADNTIKDPIASIDVSTDTGLKPLAKKEISGTDFRAVGKYQCFTLDLEHTDPAARIEFRVFCYNKTDLWLDRIELDSPAYQLKKL